MKKNMEFEAGRTEGRGRRYGEKRCTWVVSQGYSHILFDWFQLSDLLFPAPVIYAALILRSEAQKLLYSYDIKIQNFKNSKLLPAA